MPSSFGLLGLLLTLSPARLYVAQPDATLAAYATVSGSRLWSAPVDAPLAADARFVIAVKERAEDPSARRLEVVVLHAKTGAALRTCGSAPLLDGYAGLTAYSGTQTTLVAQLDGDQLTVARQSLAWNTGGERTIQDDAPPPRDPLRWRCDVTTGAVTPLAADAPLVPPPTMPQRFGSRALVYGSDTLQLRTISAPVTTIATIPLRNFADTSPPRP